MTPNEKWFKAFVEKNGRQPSQAEYEAAKAKNFVIDKPKKVHRHNEKASKQLSSSNQSTKKSGKKLWLVGLGIVLLVVLGVGGVIGVQALSPKQTTRPILQTNVTKSKHRIKAKATSAPTKQSQSESSKQTGPDHEPSTAEKLALLLMAPGATKYTVTGDELLAGHATHTNLTPDSPLDEEVATPQSDIEGMPSDGEAYSLTCERDGMTPFVIITTDTMYLVSGQQVPPFSYFQENGMQVNITDLWDQNYASQKLADVAAKITVNEE